MKEKTKERYIYTIFFFLFPGYYAGLSLIFYFGLNEVSGYYSIPLRIYLSFLMLRLILHSPLRKTSSISNVVFLLFSFLYVFKVLYAEFNNDFLLRSWGEYIFYYLSYCFFPFYFIQKLDFNRYLVLIINSILVSGVAFGVICLIQFFPYLLSGGIGRLSEITLSTGEEVISPLALSYSGSITILIAIFNIVFKQNRNKFLNYTAVILGLILLLLGATRGAFLVLIIGLFVILYYSSFKNKFKISGILFLAFPLMLYFVELTGSSLFKRFENTIQEGDNSGRDELFFDAYEEFLSSPLVGGRIEVNGIYPHNFFLEILMSTGLIGLVLILFLVFNFFININFAIRININFLPLFLIFLSGLVMGQFSNALYASILIFLPLGFIFNKYLKNQAN